MSGLASELAMNVREKKGLAYYVGAFQQTGIQPGAFILYAGTRPDKVAEVEEMMREEAKRLTTKGLTQEELDRARKQIISEHDMALQDNFDLTMKAAIEELIGLGYEHVFNVRERITKVTGDDVRTAAGSILSTNRMAVSIVLPEPDKAREE
jgi:zinc protease